MTTINDDLNAIDVGLSQVFKNITMFPLFRQDAMKSNYLTLDEALEAGTARVTEVSEGGNVPEGGVRGKRTGQHNPIIGRSQAAS